MLLTSSAGAAPPEPAPGLGPFQAFESIPAQVDGVAVFENPAENLLLSPVGRTMRSLLAMGGVFTQTERAWQAMGQVFNAPVDDAIRTLLSNRVVVVWDGFERGTRDLQGLTESIDTRWALICEVEPKDLQTIRTAMKPVKRDIVHGRPVYAIEQGRYRVVMLESRAPGQRSTVLLAPSNGVDLLHRVLAHLVQDQKPDQASASMTAGHESMLAELSQEHDKRDSTPPTVAFMVRTSTLLNTLLPGSIPMNVDEPAADPVLAAMIKLDQQSLRCTFASDLPVNPELRDAPVALLDAVAHDAVFSLAASRAMRFNLNDESLSITMGVHAGPIEAIAKSANADDAVDAQDIFDAPMLLTIAPLASATHASDARRLGVCVAFEHPRRAPGQTALLVDDTIERLTASFDPAQAPEFQGRFPAVPRTLSWRSAPRANDDPEQPGWLEQNPQLAWLTSPSTEHDLVIASIGPDDTDPMQRVIETQQAAQTLEALGAQPPSGVLLRLRMQPAQTLELFNENTIMDLMLAKLVRELGIDVRRGLRSGIRGSMHIDFASPVTKPGLGIK